MLSFSFKASEDITLQGLVHILPCTVEMKFKTV